VPPAAERGASPGDRKREKREKRERREEDSEERKTAGAPFYGFATIFLPKGRSDSIASFTC